MIEVMALLGAIQASLDCAKGISEGMKAVREVDQKLALLDIRDKQIQLIGSLQDAKEKILELNAQLLLREQMEHDPDGNIMWRVVNQKNLGPYCSTCYGDAGKAISLSTRMEKGAWDCPKCKNFFNTHQWDQDQLEKQRALRQSHGWPG